MERKPILSHPGYLLALGSVWGLSEAALGLGLGRCASLASGSIMTGAALFFIAGAWALTRNMTGIVCVVVVSVLFKGFDAWLLSIPVFSGTVVNPVFAFIVQGTAFGLLVTLFRGRMDTRKGRIILGLLAAFGAALLFPLVKFATRIPACLYPGTRIPLSIAFGPVAMALSAVTVPAGLRVGERLSGRILPETGRSTDHRTEVVVSPIVILSCLVLMTIIRIV